MDFFIKKNYHGFGGGVVQLIYYTIVHSEIIETKLFIYIYSVLGIHQ